MSSDLATVDPLGRPTSPPTGWAGGSTAEPPRPAFVWTGPAEMRRPEQELHEPTRLSQRILLHIARQGRAPLEGTVSHELCQGGIAESLGVSQGALAGVLRRLEVGGVLESARAHVEGHDRRIKVYRLTPRGEEVVRRLWREFPNAMARSSPPGSRASRAVVRAPVVGVREPRDG